MFVDHFAEWTGSDVAASGDISGHESLGGDWILEYAFGDISTEMIVSDTAQASWYGTLDISTGLQLHLELDETSGSTVNDSSGNSNNGNLVGNTSFETGEIGGGIGFDYTDGEDYIEIPNSATLENVQEGDYTLAAWFNPNSTPPGSGGDNDANYGILVKTGWHSGIYYASDNHFKFDHVLAGNTAIGVVSTDTFAPGQFYHVTGVVDRAAGTVSIYVDGQHQGTSNFTAGTAAREYGTETWKVGIASPSAVDWGWAADGTIDDARIYDRALSSTDISELYNPNLANVSFQQGVNGYSGTVDTFLNEGLITQDNSGNVDLQVDLNDGAGDETTQALLRFENLFGTGTGQIPYNVLITSASLTVNVNNVSDAGATITLHEMLEAWSDTDTWSTTGGILLDDVEATSTAISTLSNPTSLGTVTFTGLESSIQSWLDNTSTNYGWLFSLAGSNNGWDFDSSESGNQPVLLVSYVVPGSQTSAVHTLTVDTANDVLDGDVTSIDTLLANRGADGLISLREAIWATNNTSNFDTSTPDVINFAIGTGGQTIMVNAGGLPTITDAVVLDATTQSGYSGTPLITLDGTNAAGATGGIVLRTNDSVIRGFNVINFPDEGIEIDGSTGYGDNNLIENNWVGITAAGAAAGNADDGILITVDADNNVVRNNIVGSSGGDGILIRSDSDNNWIWGNVVGLSSDGVTIRANTGHGIRIEGNSTSNTIGTDGDGTNDANERNVVSGNATGGIYVTGAGTDNNVIAGNLVGVDGTGTILIGNSGNNININQGASNTIVGGTVTVAGNTIAGAAGDAITIWSSSTTGTIVQGNTIGTDATGTLDWGNGGSGVVVSGGASGTLIGGTSTNESNVIAFNHFGVAVWDWNSDNNAILGNSIYRNDELGIELEGLGVNPNDSNDSDTGANDGQNTPVFTSVSHLAGNTTADFELDTNQAGNYLIQFFTSDIADNSGKTLVHSVVIAHGGGGVQAFSEVFSTAANAIITATATEDFGGSYGSTSEFSQARTANGKYAFVVDTTSDVADGTTNLGVEGLLFNRGADGRISLREAIAAANSESGTTELIQFEIKDALIGGAHTIDITAGGLDAISDTIILDATTDSDFAGQPMIVLNGSLASNADGLNLISGSDGSTVRGLAINQFENGIVLVNTAGNTIVGNYIGTDASGTATGLGNANRGIILDNSGSNQIGGATAADRNVIVASGDDGINLWGVGTTLNVIQGNYVGVDATGNAGLGNNADGINIAGNANNNTIGGDRTAGEGNVISGQIGGSSDGIEIDNAGANHNQIYGNYIGTNYDGTAIIANARHGVVIYDGVQGTEVGGTGVGQGNIISGNAGSGVLIDGNGVATTTNNAIASNYIGTDVTGLIDLGNAGHGVQVFGSASGNTIGGTSSAHRNVISGNTGDGINSSGHNLTIAANYIGSNASGTGEIANSGDGIDLNGGTNTTIGGTTAAERNVISGNDGFGVYMNSATSGNYVLNNYIGTDATGATDIANLDGIWVDGSSGNFIGQAGDGNLVSGNEFYGIVLDGFGANNNWVQANYIGTDAAGTAAVANHADGVYITNGAHDNLIGGTVAAAGNLISGNVGNGIRISGATSNANTISYNSIGTDLTGTFDLGNLGSGIYLAGGDANVIRDNLISGNDLYGINLASSDVTNSIIAGNTIGLNAAGTASLFNGSHAINVSSASGTMIGGSVAADRNVINANYPGDYAINVSSATNTDITGNYIGTDALGTTALESGSFAINISNSSTTQVGGPAAGEENVIGGYGVVGVRVTSGGATIQGNYIGTDKLASVNLAAGGLYGVGLFSASGVLVGGPGSTDGNVIANHTTGIHVTGTGTGNSFRRNRIFNNSGLGIDLKGDGVTANDAGDGDGISPAEPNELMNFPIIYDITISGGNVTITGEARPGATVEFFQAADDGNTHGEAAEFIGSGVVAGATPGTIDATARQFSFVFSVGSLTTSDSVTATATDASNNTSEFATNVDVNYEEVLSTNTARRSTRLRQATSFPPRCWKPPMLITRPLS